MWRGRLLDLEELLHAHIVYLRELVQGADLWDAAALLDIANGHGIHAQDFGHALLGKVARAAKLLNAMA